MTTLRTLVSYRIPAAKSGVRTACCAVCERRVSQTVLAPLDCRATYDRAIEAEYHDFERNDLLCQACRDELEREFGTWTNDRADHTWDDR